MVIRKIAQIGHPVLRQTARTLSREALESPRYQQLIEDLIETMRDANGAGLAANQIYEPVQVCVLEVGDNPRYPYKPRIPLTVLVNPRVEPLSSESFENYEGCLSVPNLRGLVRRFARVRVRAMDREGNPIDQELVGFTAGTIQHEVDHLFGTLFVDRVEDPTTLTTWDQYLRFRQDAFLEKAADVVRRYHAPPGAPSARLPGDPRGLPSVARVAPAEPPGGDPPGRLPGDPHGSRTT